MDTFPETHRDHPSLGQSYLENNIFSGTLVLFNDSTGSWPLATTGLAADTIPGPTASLGDPGRLNPFRNTSFDQLKKTQLDDSNDMAGTSFLGGAHVDTEAKRTSFSALCSLPVGKPDEADDKLTVANIDRLFDINHGKVCHCLNCLSLPSSLHGRIIRDQFPALEKISCRIEGCTWNVKIVLFLTLPLIWEVICHEESHFCNKTRDHNRKLIYTCKDDRCQIRTKRKDDVKRHYATVHCKNPQRFPCHVIGCKFGGENGFTRKDKLTSHMKSTHKGLPLPGKRLQAIKPKTGVSNAGVHKAGSQA